VHEACVAGTYVLDINPAVELVLSDGDYTFSVGEDKASGRYIFYRKKSLIGFRPASGYIKFETIEALGEAASDPLHSFANSLGEGGDHVPPLYAYRVWKPIFGTEIIYIRIDEERNLEKSGCDG
jgi:hypothetical protein